MNHMPSSPPTGSLLFTPEQHAQALKLVGEFSLLEGSGRFMRHVKVRPDDARDAVALKALIHAAYKALEVQLQHHGHRGA
jgi:hypothetical protein